MKREIKFRGKRLDNEGADWIIGNLHIPNRLFTGIFICPDTIYGDVAPGFEDGDNFEVVKSRGAAIGHYHRVVPGSVGQFTGLKDKNGKEIYEGDIVKIKTGSVYDKQLFTIGFRMGSFEMQAKNDLPPLSFIYMAVQLRNASKITKDVQTMDHIEVIGNIYENSELINN